ncbi:MAG: hypothetical protein ACLTSX_05120 [Collinsella sp.]
MRIFDTSRKRLRRTALPLAWRDSSPFHSPCLAWASSPMPPHCRR